MSGPIGRPLNAQITTVPCAADPARGADALARLPGLEGAARGLIHGMTGSSRFLAGLVSGEAGWLEQALATPPEDSLAALLTACTAGPHRNPDAMLRARRRKLALLVALCDLGGIWSLEAVTGALTRFADFAVQTALDHHLAEQIARGRLPRDADGLFVLAMGKMGAAELNYSSDIDLICLFDETRFAPGDYAEVRSGFVRVVQQMVRTLSAQTAQGYVLRTDLRLRPDPASTPVCIGAGMAETYYESAGRGWERAAMIKARPCAGDLAAGSAFLRAIAPFVWRRHLDFAAIEDAYDMQRRIRDHKGLVKPIGVPGHDIKLGRGGIRSIEFFVQTRQLIGGGRDRDLRGRGTLSMLVQMAKKGLVADEIAQSLSESYRAHRALEHRIQMLEDTQTHSVPRAAVGRARVAALFGRSDIAAFEAELQARLHHVEDLTEAFFAPGSQTAPPVPNAEALTALGYAEPFRALALVERWRSGALAATRSPRARAILARIAGEILRRLAKAARPDDALARFDGFLAGLPAGVQILALFEANPQLLDLLAEICAASPRLAEALSRRASMLDAVLDRGFFAPLQDATTLQADLAAHLAAEGDYERVLDAARRWAHEQQFRAGVQLLRGTAQAAETGRAFSAVAEVALRALLPHVETTLAARHGPPPGRGAVVLAMGRLGSQEMTISSDLDLILVYDADGVVASDGPKPIAATVYYARLTKALIAAMSALTAEGRLYEVDMRLRPSGRQGPVAVSLAGFASYQRSEAWAWEHMALTRARVVAGSGTLARDVETVIAEILASPRPLAPLLGDVRSMRDRLARAQSGRSPGPWEMKHGPGGLLEIELMAQAGILAGAALSGRATAAMLPALAQSGFLEARDAEALAEAHALGSTVQHLARLAMAGPFRPETAGAGLVDAMLSAAAAPDLAALQRRLGTLRAAAAAIVTARLG